MNSAKSTLTPVLTAAALAVAACSGPGSPDQQAGSDVEQQSRVDDVTGLEPVETFTLITTAASEDPRRYEEARLIVEAWQAAGIPVELEPLARAELSRRGFASKEFDVYHVSYDPVTERLDPDNFLARFWSPNAVDDGSNLSGLANAEYDELYEAQLRATNEEERRQLVFQAQRMLFDLQPVLPYVHLAIGGAYNSANWDGAVDGLGNPTYHLWNAIAMQPRGERSALVVGVTTEAPNLNPVTATTVEATQPLSYLYDSLLRVGPDGELVTWAAEDYSMDGTEVTVTLRDDLAFHDGEPVTTEDVVFTFDYLVAQDAPLYAGALNQVQQVSADERTIVIELAEPSASFATTVLAQIPILPAHIWEEVSDAAEFANEEPVGSGPFRFGSRRLGAELRMDANPDHFQSPAADAIVWAVFGDLDSVLAALRAGEIDMLGEFVSVSQLAALENAQNVTVTTTASHGWNGLHLNMRRTPFDDRHFRRALAHLMPVDDVIETVLGGDGFPAGSVIAPNLSWHDPELEPFPRDPDRAMAELADAGYVWGPDGALYYPPEDQDERIFDND